MASFLRRLGLILWKNCLIRRRHYIVTILEVIIPVGLFCLLAWINSFSPNLVVSDKNATYYPIVTEGEVIETFTSDKVLLYTPVNNFTNSFMEKVQLKFVAKGRSIGCVDEKELEEQAAILTSNTTYYTSVFGVVFDGSFNTNQTKLRYKIRSTDFTWHTDILFPEYQYSGPMDVTWAYENSGFMALQLCIDKTFIEHVLPQPSRFTYQFAVQKFPYPPYRDKETLSQVRGYLLQFFTVAGFLVLCPVILKRIVEEKQTGVKELMKMMGMQNWMIWLGWMVNTLAVNVISVTLITCILKVPFNDIAPGVIPYTNAGILWFMLLLYCISSTTMCFAISSFFSRSVLAITFGVIVWIVTFVVPVTVQAPSIPLKYLFALLPNGAMSLAFQIITMFESKGVGVQSSNILEPASGRAYDVNMMSILAMFLVNIIMYSLITWYVGSIMPGQYGIAKPWYFCFVSNKINHEDSTLRHGQDQGKSFETVPDNVTVGISIKELFKVFQTFGSSQKKVAVAGVNLDIYQNQITALLGHNGAGKTTTMSIITGLFSPTSGTVEVNGHDILHDLDKVRSSLGLCPQHNMLFTDLTVRQHLIFFAMLKGSSRKDASLETNQLLRDMNLIQKADDMSSTLSGGMKRKLSLAIALVGDSKVLLLDEPTSGMDPEARRGIWDMLLTMRGQRTIVITTHFMEEADVLGDRIAIMDHGMVKCYGTSLYLKKLYGAGYHLSLQKMPVADARQILVEMQKVVPSADLKSETGSDLAYNLPSDQTEHFPQLFDYLEKNKQELGIMSIGVSITTLEEVFLKVGRESADEIKTYHSSSSAYDNEVTTVIISNELPDKKMSGIDLFVQQLKALFIKRALFSRRKWLLFTTVVLVALAMTVSTLLMSNQKGSPAEHQLLLSLNNYRVASVPFSFLLGVDPAIPREYGALVGGTPLSPKTTVTDELMRQGEADEDKFRTEMLVAAEFNSTQVPKDILANAMYSGLAYHGAPISVNLVTNAILKSLTSANHSITTINHPIKRGKDGELSLAITLLAWLTVFPMGLLFLTSSFIMFPLSERISQAKQLQLMTGLSPPLYWLVCYLWDMALYLVVAFVMLIFVWSFQGPFSGCYESGTIALVLVLYGVSSIPFTYCFSYLNKTTGGGFSLILVVNLFIGVIMAIVVGVMTMEGNEHVKGIGKTLEYIFYLIPYFCLSYGLMAFSAKVLEVNTCRGMKPEHKTDLCFISPSSICCKVCLNSETNCKDQNPYMVMTDENGTPGIGSPLLAMMFDLLLYVAILLLVESGLVSKLYEAILNRVFRAQQPKGGDHDEDVAEEQDRVDGEVQGEEPTNNTLLVCNMAKTYGTKFPAVKGISFAVAQGECFGLLGVNGAGKTTTFKMLTGDEVPTQGDAYLDGFPLHTRRSEYLARIGYCPQFDAINEVLTGKEILRLFAQLRGVPTNNVSGEVCKWLNLLGLTEYQNVMSGNYSGGNKRKLSTAIALIGDPPVVFLDEPTSGVDPVSRRKLWNVLSRIQKSGQAVVLTSHSMEECEALCQRLAIMVNGQFVCIGNIQHLKQKFGQGFTVMIKLTAKGITEQTLAELKSVFEEMFEHDCVLKDEHQGILHYHILNSEMPWRHLFKTMEYLKNSRDIVEDYTISETTLEQVFLSFAKLQQEDRTDL